MCALTCIINVSRPTRTLYSAYVFPLKTQVYTRSWTVPLTRSRAPVSDSLQRAHSHSSSLRFLQKLKDVLSDLLQLPARCLLQKRHKVAGCNLNRVAAAIEVRGYSRTKYMQQVEPYRAAPRRLCLWAVGGLSRMSQVCRPLQLSKPTSHPSIKSSYKYNSAVSYRKNANHGSEVLCVD